MRFPHPLTLLLGAVIIAAALTWILPAGEFERAEHPETGREVVVAGSYHRVERAPVGPFDTIVALPRGMIEAADVIFLVFLVGGAFMVIDRTGAFQAGLDRLVRRARRMLPRSAGRCGRARGRVVVDGVRRRGGAACAACETHRAPAPEGEREREEYRAVRGAREQLDVGDALRDADLEGIDGAEGGTHGGGA